MKTLWIFIFGFTLVWSDPSNDLITGLPNLDGDLNTQYSGYINIPNTQKYFHYWFVASFGNPSSDPLVLWLNGGPGCSSMDGYFYEQGPFHFGQPDSNLTLVNNPWTWCSISNMIFLESPVGVGFSYSTNQSDYNLNDDIAAQDNYNFLKAWFQQFPEYSKNEFWIAGESYAGIYVPTLAKLVVQDSSINFQGVLVGNGLSDYKYDNEFQSLFPFMYRHALISTITWNQYINDCVNGASSVGCDTAIHIMEMNLNYIDIYDIYSDCYSAAPIEDKYFPQYQRISVEKALQRARTTRAHRFGETPPCTDASQLTNYLNTPAVQEAIHVNSNLGYNWTICSIINYDKNTFTVVPIYEDLILHRKKILIYSGDVDGAVPYVGTEKWINSMNITVKLDGLWKEWYVSDDEGSQVAGYVTYYEEGLTFATVKGAGHMVPQYKPEAAFYMFQNFISGKPL